MVCEVLLLWDCGFFCCFLMCDVVRNLGDGKGTRWIEDPVKRREMRIRGGLVFLNAALSGFIITTVLTLIL